MTIWNWLFGSDTLPGSCDTHQASVSTVDVNPATGLPMVGGCDGFDVGGSPYGLDLSPHAIDNQPIADFDFGSGRAGFDGDWPC